MALGGTDQGLLKQAAKNEEELKAMRKALQQYYDEVKAGKQNYITLHDRMRMWQSNWDQQSLTYKQNLEKVAKQLADGSGLKNDLAKADVHLKQLDSRLAFIGKELEEMKKNAVTPGDIKLLAQKIVALEQKVK